MCDEAGLMRSMGTGGNIKALLDIFNSLGRECETLFKTTKSQALSLLIKAIRAAEQTTGSERPPLFVIPPFYKSLSEKYLYALWTKGNL